MADKFRKTQPLLISFSDAEQPTAAKLTAVATQARNGSALLEKVIGDPWTQSGDAVLTSHPLQIPNLARQLGASRFLDPTMYPLDQEFDYTDIVGTKFENMTEGRFLFKPKAAGFHDAANSTGPFANAP